MNDLKFRAWDKARQTMKYPEPYYRGEHDTGCPENLKGKLCPSELIDSTGHKSHISDVLMSDMYIPMLYTGRNDDYQNEIYEGDIIRDHLGIGYVEYCDKHAAFRVNYGNGQCKSSIGSAMEFKMRSKRQLISARYRMDAVILRI